MQRTSCLKQKKIDLRITAAEAESVVEAYHRVKKAGTSHLDNASKEKQHKWIPPPRNVFKVNVDAAVSSKDQMAGLGAGIKASNSNMIAAGIKQTQLKRDVSFA